MNKKLATILAGIIFIGAMPQALCAGEIGLCINNEPIKTEAKPIQERGTTLVPLRVVSNHLGANIDYANGYIIITRENTNIELKIGRKQAMVNGQKVNMLMAPKTIKGVTYIPLRFVAEQLNCEVAWKESTGVVEIIAKNAEVENVQKVTIAQALKNVEKAYGNSVHYVFGGMMHAWGTLDDRLTQEYYVIHGADQDGNILDGCFYVHMYTGEIYFNYPDGNIERLSDGVIVGQYNG